MSKPLTTVDTDTLDQLQSDTQQSMGSEGSGVSVGCAPATVAVQVRVHGQTGSVAWNGVNIRLKAGAATAVEKKTADHQAVFDNLPAATECVVTCLDALPGEIEVTDVADDGRDGPIGQKFTIKDVVPLEYLTNWRAYTVDTKEVTVTSVAGNTTPVTFELRPRPEMTIARLLERLMAFDAELAARAAKFADTPIGAAAAMLAASPLTINFLSSDLKNRIPEFLNGYQVEARYGKIPENIAIKSTKADDKNYDLRMNAEHVGFGYPFDRATNSQDTELDAVRCWTDDCRIGAKQGVLVEPYAATVNLLSLLHKPHRRTVHPDLRPKYGALDFRDSGRGAAPDDFYGLSYFRMKDAVKQRATFTLGDSWNAVTEEGDTVVTLRGLALMLAQAIKMGGDDYKALLSHLARRVRETEDTFKPAWYSEAHSANPYKEGEPYIEAQILGELSFDDCLEGIYISKKESGATDLQDAKTKIDPDGKFAKYKWVLFDDTV